MLPWLAGILIILLGFGVLSWRPQKKRKSRKHTGRRPSAKASHADSSPKKRPYRKDQQTGLGNRATRKISGVAAGLAEYFDLDPTLMRIAFVVALIVSGGPPAILAYVITAIIMPSPDASQPEKVIRIIEDP